MVLPPTRLQTSFFPCVALVMPFSRGTNLQLSMTLACLSGTKSLCRPLGLQALGEWVASSPLAKARWYKTNEVAQLPLIRNKQKEAVKPLSCCRRRSGSGYLWI